MDRSVVIVENAIIETSCCTTVDDRYRTSYRGKIGSTCTRGSAAKSTQVAILCTIDLGGFLGNAAQHLK